MCRRGVFFPFCVSPRFELAWRFVPTPHAILSLIFSLNPCPPPLLTFLPPLRSVHVLPAFAVCLFVCLFCFFGVHSSVCVSLSLALSRSGERLTSLCISLALCLFLSSLRVLPFFLVFHPLIFGLFVSFFCFWFFALSGIPFRPPVSYVGGGTPLPLRQHTQAQKKNSHNTAQLLNILTPRLFVFFLFALLLCPPFSLDNLSLHPVSFPIHFLLLLRVRLLPSCFLLPQRWLLHGVSLFVSLHLLCISFLFSFFLFVQFLLPSFPFRSFLLGSNQTRLIVLWFPAAGLTAPFVPFLLQFPRSSFPFPFPVIVLVSLLGPLLSLPFPSLPLHSIADAISSPFFFLPTPVHVKPPSTPSRLL